MCEPGARSANTEVAMSEVATNAASMALSLCGPIPNEQLAAFLDTRRRALLMEVRAIERLIEMLRG